MAPFAKDAAEIATDVAEGILRDCPEALKPSLQAPTKELHFQNGSVIRFKGVNGEHAKFLRGTAADLIILDECGIMDDLKHVVSDICMPMLLTTNGHLLLCSTPARSPGHESYALYDDLCAQGSSARFTIRDAPHIRDEVKAEYLVEAGEAKEEVPHILAGTAFPRTTTVRREYFCEWVTDADTAVLREFDADAKGAIVRVVPRPSFFTPYVAMDPGFNDRTGILFAYYDFLAGNIVVEDERLLSRASTPDIAYAVMDAETTLWGAAKIPNRVTDVDLRLIEDLRALHGLQFSKARKEDSLGAINLVRTMIKGRQLVINPRCTSLIRQMEYATWNHKATDFERTEKDGHFDLLAALKYLCRYVDRSRNPYPAGYRIPGRYARPADERLSLMSDTPFSRRLQKKKPL